jgi:hypothetical protein
MPREIGALATLKVRAPQPPEIRPGSDTNAGIAAGARLTRCMVCSIRSSSG